MPVLGLEDPNQAADRNDPAVIAAVKRADIILALSAISILVCWISGAVATYKAYQARQDALAGNLFEAEQGIRMAKVWMIVSFGVLGVSLLINVIFRLTGWPN